MNDENKTLLVYNPYIGFGIKRYTDSIWRTTNSINATAELLNGDTAIAAQDVLDEK